MDRGPTKSLWTDWVGRPLNLHNHHDSRGRVVAASSSHLHAQALEVLSQAATPSPRKDHVLIPTLVASVAAIAAIAVIARRSLSP